MQKNKLLRKNTVLNLRFKWILRCNLIRTYFAITLIWLTPSVQNKFVEWASSQTWIIGYSNNVTLLLQGELRHRSIYVWVSVLVLIWLII